jgi:hypothetical protein
LLGCHPKKEKPLAIDSFSGINHAQLISQTKASSVLLCREWKEEKIKEEEIGLSSHSNGGSVVECSPATRAARVRFPAVAISFFLIEILAKYFYY